MAPQHMIRPNTQRLSALALAALSLGPLSAPADAQTVYREYEDGTVETLPGDGRDLSAAPLRRPPPRAFDEDEDERFEREDDDDDDNDDDDQDEDGDDRDRQGTLDLAPDSPIAEADGANRPEVARKAPVPPPSVDAKPDEKAWKPAL